MDGQPSVGLPAIASLSLYVLLLYLEWRLLRHPRLRRSAAWRTIGDLEASRIVGAVVLILFFALLASGLLR